MNPFKGEVDGIHRRKIVNKDPSFGMKPASVIMRIVFIYTPMVFAVQGIESEYAIKEQSPMNLQREADPGGA